MRCGILFGVLAAIASTGARADHVLNGNKIKRTIDCRGENVVVNGDKAELTLRGNCGTVRLNGNKNAVSVDLAATIGVAGNKNSVAVSRAARIEVMGNKNRVAWAAGANGPSPQISNLGSENVIEQRGAVAQAATPPPPVSGTLPPPPPPGGTVGVTVSNSGGTKTVTVGTVHGASAVDGKGVQVTAPGGTVTVNKTGSAPAGSPTGAPPPPPPSQPPAGGGDIRVMQNEVRHTYLCAGSNVWIDGNENTIELKGECRAVTVRGNDNVVTIEAAAQISVMGNDNKVAWARGIAGKPPAVSNLGNDNKLAGKR